MITVFFICLFLLFHSYLFYPLLLRLFSFLQRKKTIHNYSISDSLPIVTVLISAYNEEKNIANKIDNILASKYPTDKIEILIGSDGSDDATNQIVSNYSEKYYNVRLLAFELRKGKSEVLNAISTLAKGDILILTDVKILFDSDTIFELVKHFKNPNIGLVAGNIVSRYNYDSGVGKQERLFMNREMNVKHLEGLVWGALMGAFGACFAMRKKCYILIPQSFSVDDFFLTLSVINSGLKTIAEPLAKAYLNLPSQPNIEFKRRVRIAVGNYQNMIYFSKWLLTPWKGASFAFISHKLIRWIGPFLLISLFLSSLLLMIHHVFFILSSIVLLFFLLSPLLDHLLRIIGLNIVILRFASHFIHMNFALLVGFIKFINGSTTHVWQPTNRNNV